MYSINSNNMHSNNFVALDLFGNNLIVIQVQKHVFNSNFKISRKLVEFGDQNMQPVFCAIHFHP